MHKVNLLAGGLIGLMLLVFWMALAPAAISSRPSEASISVQEQTTTLEQTQAELERKRARTRQSAEARRANERISKLRQRRTDTPPRHVREQMLQDLQEPLERPAPGATDLLLPGEGVPLPTAY